MLTTILLAVGAFACLMAMMAVGVIFQGKRLSGSCGGDASSKECRCSPEKQARCRSRGPTEEETEVESGLLLRRETGATSGEDALIQLQRPSV